MVGSSWAATFYVDATSGIDTNDGLSTATAWKTVAKVNGATFAAGDQILFKRGQVWNESLAPPSSGASGNPIVFDAYGTGEAPTLTGYVGLPSASWTLDSGNIWKTSITSSSFNYVLFGYIGSDGTVGSVWGTKFTTGKSALVAPYQFYFSSNVLYVYATSNPASYYGSMAAMLMTNGQIIYINGKSWLTIQHFRVSYFDAYGVRIGGASDHITIANVYSDGMIPAGTTPHGFYVSASPAPTDIKFYNVDAHRNSTQACAVAQSAKPHCQEASEESYGRDGEQRGMGDVSAPDWTSQQSAHGCSKCPNFPQTFPAAVRAD